MSPDVIFGGIGVVLFAALAFEVWKYIRNHPQAVKDLEERVMALEGKEQEKLADVLRRIEEKLSAPK